MSTAFSLVSWGCPRNRRFRNLNSDQSAPAGGSSGRLHCGGRPSIPHQAKTMPRSSRVSKTLSFAVLGGGAKGVATHWPVTSNS